MLQTGTPGTGMFLSPVPEPPGDPAALADAAARYTAAQGELDRNRANVAGIKAEAIQVQWAGVGAYSFGDVTAELTAAYTRTAAAYAQAAVALRSYATGLATAQQTARHANAAIAESNSLATALLNAQATATQNQATAEAAAQSAATAEAQAAANPHLPPARLAADTARTTANDAQITASNAWIKVTNLTGEYDTVHGRATILAAEAHTQATTATAKAAAAFDAVTGQTAGQQLQPARGGATGVPSASLGLVIGYLDGARMLWAAPTTRLLALEKELPAAERNVQDAERAAMEKLMAARRLQGKGARMPSDARDQLNNAYQEERALQGKIDSAARLESPSTDLAAGNAEGLTDVLGGASAVAKAVPLIGTGASGLVTTLDDLGKGESGYQAVADGVASSGAALGTATGVAGAIGTSSIAVAGGGAVAAGAAAIGAGDLVHHLVQDLPADWSKDGVLDGTIDAWGDSISQTGSDIRNVVSDAWHIVTG